MGTSILNIGVTGLMTAQAGLTTTGHNISNAATPGFSRQQIVSSTNNPQYFGNGYLGQGANVESVVRIYNQFLSSHVLTARAGLSEVEAYHAQIKQIDNLLADPNAGLTPALQGFFAGVNQVASNPASLPARQSMLSAAQALATRFQAIDTRLNEIRDGVDAQIAGVVSEINSYATQIAELNQRIVSAQAASVTHYPNDLLDQRDQLVAELNERVRATTLTQSDGSFSVFIGNGQPLVIGMQTFAMTAAASTEDSSRTVVGITLPSGGTSVLPESMLSGGALGGYLAFRSGSLDEAQNSLGRIALVLAEDFNGQHRLGQDLTGALGADFFSAPTPAVVSRTSPAYAGTAVIDVAVATPGSVTASDYRLTAAGAGSFTLTRLSDGATVFSGVALPQTADGLTFSVASGAAGAGDSWLIQPTRNAASSIAVALTDARSIAAATPVRTAAGGGNLGTGTISAGSVSTTTGLPLAASPGGDITLTFDSTLNQFTVAGGPGGTLAYNPATEGAGKTFSFPTVGGFTFTVAGVPNDGDTFVISRNANGVSDNRNALLLAGLQTASTIAGGVGSYQSAFSQIVGTVGHKTREMEVTVAAQESMLQEATDAQQAVSGVNLDEEAANLLRYQQLYQASGKMIEIAGRLFDQILELGG